MALAVSSDGSVVAMTGSEVVLPGSGVGVSGGRAQAQGTRVDDGVGAAGVPEDGGGSAAGVPEDMEVSMRVRARAAEVTMSQSNVRGSGWRCTGEGTAEVAGTPQTMEVAQRLASVGQRRWRGGYVLEDGAGDLAAAHKDEKVDNNGSRRSDVGTVVVCPSKGGTVAMHTRRAGGRLVVKQGVMAVCGHTVVKQGVVAVCGHTVVKQGACGGCDEDGGGGGAGVNDGESKWRFGGRLLEGDIRMS
jgi:hypothetical protein